MLDGWYCRTMASEQLHPQNDTNLDSGSEDDESQDENTAVNNNQLYDIKNQYNTMKTKLKFLLYVSKTY